jgi:hypothetical protein
MERFLHHFMLRLRPRLKRLTQMTTDNEKNHFRESTAIKPLGGFFHGNGAAL